MSDFDPAVEAVRRAWPGNRKLVQNRPREHMEAAVREAFKPLQELHRPHQDGIGLRICAECSYTFSPHRVCGVPWPCATARLIYPEESLTK